MAGVGAVGSLEAGLGSTARNELPLLTDCKDLEAVVLVGAVPLAAGTAADRTEGAAGGLVAVA